MESFNLTDRIARCKILSQKFTVIFARVAGVKSKAGAVTERRAVVPQKSDHDTADLAGRLLPVNFAAGFISVCCGTLMNARNRADFSSLSLDWFLTLSPVTEAQASFN